MSKPSSSKTQTQTVEPPAFAKPYIEAGYGQASQLYNQGGPQFYPNDTFVPFAPQSEQAMQMTANRAMNGSPLMQSGQGYVNQTLSGDFLNGNPWLDKTFDRAAQQTRGAMDSQFATAGRNLQAQMPWRSEQLNNLATNIYGGAYDAERNRQQQVLPFVQNFANQDYIDAGALQGVGSQVEGKAGEVLQSQMDRWNFNQQRPEAALDSYLSRIAMNTQNAGQTSTSPLNRNVVGDAIGGGLTGYGLASLANASNPWLWAAGMGLGSLFG
jgi:hypothetical protein